MVEAGQVAVDRCEWKKIAAESISEEKRRGREEEKEESPLWNRKKANIPVEVLLLKTNPFGHRRHRLCSAKPCSVVKLNISEYRKSFT